MHTTYLFSYLAVLGALGSIVSGSPLEPRQELSDDEGKALGVIKDKKLGDFCDGLLSHNDSKRDLDAAAQLLARQNVNTNINNNESEGDGDGDNVSYSSSYSNGHEDVDYKINTITVPDDLKGYYPDAIEKACKDYKDKSKREVNAARKTIHIQKRIIYTSSTTTENITNPPVQGFATKNPMAIPPRQTAPVIVQATVLTTYYYVEPATPTAVVTKVAGRWKTSKGRNLIHNIPSEFFGEGGAVGRVGKAGVI